MSSKNIRCIGIIVLKAMLTKLRQPKNSNFKNMYILKGKALLILCQVCLKDVVVEENRDLQISHNNYSEC